VFLYTVYACCEKRQRYVHLCPKVFKNMDLFNWLTIDADGFYISIYIFGTLVQYM